MQACVVEEPRAVLFRRFEQLCSVSTESERSIHVLEGPGMVTEDYIREAAVDDERIVIRPARDFALTVVDRSEAHTSELQSLMRTSYAVFCLKKKNPHEIIDLMCIDLKFSHRYEHNMTCYTDH